MAIERGFHLPKITIWSENDGPRALRRGLETETREVAWKDLCAKDPVMAQRVIDRMQVVLNESKGT